MAQEVNKSALGDVNSSALGASFPEVELPDGTKIQTGTVGALLVNIKEYDALVLGQGKASDDEIAALEERFKAALPTIFKAGLFELFPPEEWVAGKRASPGRARVGELALDYQRART